MDAQAEVHRVDRDINQVEREYEARLANASLFVRWLLRLEIRKEIVKRINEIAPREAVY